MGLLPIILFGVKSSRRERLSKRVKLLMLFGFEMVPTRLLLTQFFDFSYTIVVGPFVYTFSLGVLRLVEVICLLLAAIIGTIEKQDNEKRKKENH